VLIRVQEKELLSDWQKSYLFEKSEMP
jgi:hypothetical protein